MVKHTLQIVFLKSSCLKCVWTFWDIIHERVNISPSTKATKASQYCWINNHQFVSVLFTSLAGSLTHATANDINKIKGNIFVNVFIVTNNPGL